MLDDDVIPRTLLAKLIEKHGPEYARTRITSLLERELADPRVDHFTGCYTRRALDEDLWRWIDEAARQRQRFTQHFLCCDVDNFVHYVDHHGLPQGDKLLQNLAERLKASCDIVYRYAGEEFVIPNRRTLIDDGELGVRLRQCIVSVDLAVDMVRRNRAGSWVLFHLHHGLVQPNFDGGKIFCTEPREWRSASEQKRQKPSLLSKFLTGSGLNCFGR